MKAGQCTYQTRSGYCKGAFAIYQARNGLVYINMSGGVTPLSLQQINDLKLDVRNLEDFSECDFHKAYLD